VTTREELMAKAQALRAEADHLRVLASHVTDTRALDAISELIEELEGRAQALQVQAGDGHRP
jgi:phage shock protein A